MSMLNEHVGAYQALGAAATTLDEKVALYVTANAAAASAQAALNTAKTALDAAVVDFNAKNTTFDTAMLTFPVGYVPPV